MKTKAHLVLPREILEEVDQIAGKRRSLFIAEAPREKLQREGFLRTLEEGVLSKKAEKDCLMNRFFIDIDVIIWHLRGMTQNTIPFRR